MTKLLSSLEERFLLECQDGRTTLDRVSTIIDIMHHRKHTHHDVPFAPHPTSLAPLFGAVEFNRLSRGGASSNFNPSGGERQ